MGARRRGLSKWWWLGPLIGASALAAILAWRGASPTEEARARQGQGGAVRVARRETRPTLDPARFVGKARLAHQVARDIPDVLDQLYCYCECDKTIGHKSLLSCFTDGHAAT
ncbi:MAG: hypothetical protein A2W08_06140 [Candidatus Rokubacteria bacterium RBG_16_73_20]|nr:MAG: hypothetical protein A2050_12835 [Candidatus Rokubacteria bacterium GWA2_73_35]OGK92405.1 MAG: hypothetical protein A2W08_06140 [Candidatus Rokubacteria bacterium RBG_16_73_20]